MTPIPGSDQGKEGTGKKENFIGKVVNSGVDVDTGSDEDYGADMDLLYEVKPLTEYDSNMYEYSVNTSQSWGSKWMVWVSFFEQVHGKFAENDIEGLEDLAEFLKGRVYEFEDLVFTEDREVKWANGHEENLADLFDGDGGDDEQDFTPSNMMVPIREVSEEELADMGVEVEGEVEEVDF